MGPATTTKYDLDLSKIGDEQLVVLAQECGYRPAANELVLRYHPLMGRLIAYQAKHTPLTAHDVEDAQQNAVFALLDAIAGYNTREMVKPGGCRFRSYGRLVTIRRFWNFVKHIRRRQTRYHCFSPTGSKKASEANQSGWENYVCNRQHQRISDSGQIAGRQEMRERLAQVLERLEEKKRALWQELAGGKKLRQIACEQGISYDAVKRQRRKLLVHLRIAILDRAEPA